MDSRMARDEHGEYLVMEGSIAQGAQHTLRTYHSSFESKKPASTIEKETRLDYRHKDGGSVNWRSNLWPSVQASGRKYTSMTTRSAQDERFPLDKLESRDIKDFYDIGHCTPCPDLSVQVERSPILYSVFSSSAHSGEFDIPRLKNVNDIPMLGQPEFISTPRGLRWMPGPRFAPLGHPEHMFPLPACVNEQCETTRHTVAERISKSPQRYSAMQSSTQRSMPIDLTRGLPGRSAAPMAATNESHDPEQVARALPMAQRPLSDSVEQTARSYQSAFSSVFDRFQTDYSLNPSETLDHHKRRQHLLESRIASIRDEMHKKTPDVSPKLRKILNL